MDNLDSEEYTRYAIVYPATNRKNLCAGSIFHSIELPKNIYPS